MNRDRAYENLANAIILQAMRDYTEGSEITKRECTNFFKSDWFEVLTDVSPDYILKVCESGWKYKASTKGVNDE